MIHLKRFVVGFLILAVSLAFIIQPILLGRLIGMNMDHLGSVYVVGVFLEMLVIGIVIVIYNLGRGCIKDDKCDLIRGPDVKID